MTAFSSDSALPLDSTPHLLSSQLLHELRTPLHQILGYAEMLLEQAQEEGRDDFSQDLLRVRSAGGDLMALFERHFTSRPAQTPVPTQFVAPDVAANSPLNFAPQNAPQNAAPLAVSQSLLPIEAFGGDAFASGTAQGRILVVDDSEINRDILARLLLRQDYQIESVASGVLALERVKSQVFDLVLLDIMMPEMDGYTVLQTLKADETTRPLPVIMISAIGEIDSVVRCIELGAEDYLPKPFNPTLLKARIGACLEKKRGRDREMRLFAQLQENYGRLQALEMLRDDLTHMIVHDLRTPLSSLLAGLQTMPMVAPLESGQQECLDIALRGGFSLLNMINDLLDISKLEAGQMELHRAPTNALKLAERAREQIAAAARNAGLEIRCDIDSTLILQVDEDKICRTLVNLLGNAIKFTPRGGNIKLSARAIDSGATLFRVQDSGEGIPTADLSRIFDKFAQVADRRAGRRLSTGLGLALCKMVVEAHHGAIWAESEIGQGSNFFFTIPYR